MAGFDITTVLGKISDTANEERLEYIPLHLIDSNPLNYYSMDGIDELAANIQMFGLMDPIRVRRQQPDPRATDGGSRYMVISGHRRRAALRKLTDEGHMQPDDKVACIVERETAAVPGIEDPETAKRARGLLEELKLIYANSDTRKMSSADTAMQVHRIRQLLTGLQDMGYEFPGKMREHVAAAAKVSESRVARLDVISKGLTEPRLRGAWQRGQINESVAYEIARYPLEVQMILEDYEVRALPNFTREQAAALMEHKKALYEQEPAAVKEQTRRDLDRFAEAGRTSEPETEAPDKVSKMDTEGSSDKVSKMDTGNSPEKVSKMDTGHSADPPIMIRRDPGPQPVAADLQEPRFNPDGTLEFDASAYLQQRQEEDDRFFEMLSEVKDGFYRKLGSLDSRQDGIERLRQRLGKAHAHHGGARGTVSLLASPKVLELHREGDPERITRTWTDVYDMLSVAALNEAYLRVTNERTKVSTVDTGPQWSTAKPKPGDYVIRYGVPEDEIPQATNTRVAHWNGESWVVKQTGVQIRENVYRWYRIPEV